MFKNKWEKADSQHSISNAIIEDMLLKAYPDRAIKSYHMISGGCINLNIYVEFKGNYQPCVLRVYLRDKKAAYREQKIGILLRDQLPVPEIFYIRKYDEYCFAIVSFLPGIPMRDLLLGDQAFDLKSLMYDASICLSKIIQYKFPAAGFFDEDLNVDKLIDRAGYIQFGKMCVKDKQVIAILSDEQLSQVTLCFERYGEYYPDKNEKNLVHADFDPSNILVNQIEGEWKISGILDWEFSFSGSFLCDVGNMLRYAHLMDPVYEQSFLEGLKASGIVLKKDWRITIYMMNILSLLDCLTRSDLKKRPNQCRDIGELIDHILGSLVAF